MFLLYEVYLYIVPTQLPVDILYKDTIRPRKRNSTEPHEEISLIAGKSIRILLPFLTIAYVIETSGS